MDRDVLTTFLDSISMYLNLDEKLVKARQVRMHSGNLVRDGDFSFPFGFILHRIKVCHKSLESSNGKPPENCGCFPPNDSTFDSINDCKNEKCRFKQELIALKEASEAWALKIEKCEIKKNRVLIFLQKQYAFKAVLGNVLLCQGVFGSNVKHRGILIETSFSEECDLDLSQLRVKYLKDFTANVARLFGYNVLTERQTSDDIGLLFTTKTERDVPDGMKAIVCGAVVNAKSRTKETKMLAKDYLKLRQNDMRTVALHKHGDAAYVDSNWGHLISVLGEATVKMELLKVKPSQTVSLSLETDYSITREQSSKGATFVLYNYARISSILKQFKERENKEMYPALVPLDEVDFSLLKCYEEWHLLHFISVYQSVISASIEAIEFGVLKPYVICIFLSTLCKTFSVYYRRIRILTDGQQHLIPVMFARIYLLKTLQVVLQSSLRLLGIDTVNQM